MSDFDIKVTVIKREPEIVLTMPLSVYGYLWAIVSEHSMDMPRGYISRMPNADLAAKILQYLPVSP